MSVDPYLDPATGVLRNRLGIARSEPFCLAQHIEDRLTHYLAEVNAIHPFREGNGRTQRAFFRQLSREAGWPLDWSGIDSDENDAASMASLRGDTAPLRQLLDALVAD